MKRPFVLGLTGSIGMGKSTTAAMFADEGADVWDADAAVEALYGPHGAALGPLSALCPQAVTRDGIDREALRAWIDADPSRLVDLERAVHPLVAEDRERFLAHCDADIAVLDVPLLFETGLDSRVDAVAVVSVPDEVQLSRVLARPHMSESRAREMISRQIPNEQKVARADYVINTLELDAARRQVQTIVREIADRVHAGDRARHGDDGILSGQG